MPNLTSNGLTGSSCKVKPAKQQTEQSPAICISCSHKKHTNEPIQVSHSVVPLAGTLQLPGGFVLQLQAKEVQHHPISSHHPILHRLASPHELQ